MKKQLFLIYTTCLIISFSGFTQNMEPDLVGWGEEVEITRTVDIEDILVEILTSSEDTLIFKNLKIVDSKTNKSGAELSKIFTAEFISKHYSDLISYDEDSLIIISPYIEISGNLHSTWSRLGFIDGLNFRKGLFIDGMISPNIIIFEVKSPLIKLLVQEREKNDNDVSGFITLGYYLPIEYAYIEQLIISSSYACPEAFISNMKLGSLSLNVQSDIDGFYMQNMVIGKGNDISIDPFSLSITGVDSLLEKDGYDLNSSKRDTEIIFGYSPFVEIRNNKFLHPNTNYLQLATDKLEFIENTINGDLEFNDLAVNQKMIFRESSVGKGFKIRNFFLPEQAENNTIRWHQFSGNKLAVLFRSPGEWSSTGIIKEDGLIYAPNSSNGYLNDNAFFEFISGYERFHRIYKETGDIESANLVYVEMKNHFTERYKYQYLADANMKSWFKWRLNQLLKVYTEHGTDPAKALVMSFYIVLLFGFIYLFFPSEWDLSSKSKIFNNIKDALEKNKKGTFKSIALSFYHLLIMIVNAFTLSLNSFTTLGFGNIPTKGLARYLTIIQGFFGWFLLGLFSVSLINQVLG